MFYNRPSECGKSKFLTNLILNVINENNKIYIYSPSLHQQLHQKVYKWFSNYLPNHITPNILNEEDIDVVIEEIVNIKDFEKYDNEIETYESIEELNFPLEYNDGDNFILDDLNEKKMNDRTVQTMFKRSRHNNLSIYYIQSKLL